MSLYLRDSPVYEQLCRKTWKGVQGFPWSPKNSVQVILLCLAEDNGRSQWIWSSTIPLYIVNSREIPANMYRPRTYDQYIACLALKEIFGSSRVLVVHEEGRRNSPYRIINIWVEQAVAFPQIGTNERLWLVRAGKITWYSSDDLLSHPSKREIYIRIMQKEKVMGRSQSSSREHVW